jgi:hypothetical protein
MDAQEVGMRLSGPQGEVRSRCRLEEVALLLRVIGCFVLTVAMQGRVQAAQPIPAPFTATLSAEYRGLSAGTLTFSFRHDEATGHYIYETRANPSMLARLIVSRDAIERSEMQIDDQGVHPLHWRVEDGKSGAKEDGELTFDATTGRVRGKLKNQPVDLPLEAGVQDRISVQIAIITALVRGAEPGTIPMVDDDHIKYYQYRKKATETLDTQLGKFETVVYEGKREGSDRVSRFWFAPSLGYTPVRAEQERKGKVETVMTIVELKR